MNSKQTLAPLLALVMLLAGCTGIENEIPRFHGEDISPVMAVEDFTLHDALAQDWNFENETEGKVVVIAFLFTNQNLCDTLL